MLSQLFHGEIYAVQDGGKDIDNVALGDRVHEVLDVPDAVGHGRVQVEVHLQVQLDCERRRVGRDVHGGDVHVRSGAQIVLGFLLLALAHARTIGGLDTFD